MAEAVKDVTKRQYRVKPGFKHGAYRQHGPDDIVELTAEEASGFLDKLELVEKPDFDLATARVDGVLEAVQAGVISAEEALEAERSGKERKSLIEALEELIA